MDYESFMELEKNYSRKISNDFLLPKDLKKRFDAGVLSVEANDFGLLIYEQRKDFIKLHFRLSDENCMVSHQDTQQPLAAFLTYRHDRYPTQAAAWLEKQGFIKTKTLRRYSTDEITGEISLKGIDFATEEETYALLREFFSPVELDMPFGDLFEGALCIRSPYGKAVGVIYMGQTLCVAVDPKHQGQGLGQRLYRGYAYVVVNSGMKSSYHEWISPDNAASIAMFERLGFSADMVYTDSFVLSEELGVRN
ncbi:MAG: GNAT family N-acetyltransferase [Oscillospiraceae bacterium]|nr:GNAT family N-acetyltransferase [Oscillospiraceae bacterium]